MVKDVHSVPACLGLNLGSASSLGLGFPLTLQSGGKVVSAPRMGVRVKGDHACEAGRQRQHIPCPQGQSSRVCHQVRTPLVLW